MNRIFQYVNSDNDPMAAATMEPADEVRPAVTARYPLEEAAEALKVVAARKAIGKIVLTTKLGRGE